MKKNHRSLNLLPFYFRNIGLGLLGFLLLSFLVKLSGWNDFSFLPHYKKLVEIVLLLSLNIIALSKGRIEDERSLEIRTRVYSSTFIFGVASYIMIQILNLFEFFEIAKEPTAFSILFQMFVFYFILMWIIKKANK